MLSISFRTHRNENKNASLSSLNIKISKYKFSLLKPSSCYNSLYLLCVSIEYGNTIFSQSEYVFLGDLFPNTSIKSKSNCFSNLQLN